ncbi:uncharacterized protein V1518DRAFT_418682 [Limtongia smithiae]|uniref:uncharacterized protein n=1 Tax=Limtongia smithiae TaxID=1125753 RepID=UPI0034D01DFB
MAPSGRILSPQWAAFLYRCSLFLLIFFTFGFAIVTPADLIAQSARKERRYNVIIVAATYFVVAVVLLILYVVRLYGVRVLLADIPKRYVPGRHDLPKSCANVIEAELRRCKIIRTTLLPSENTVLHDGLPPPKQAAVEFPLVPYIEVLMESVKLLDEKARSVHPALARRPSMALRDYASYLATTDVLMDAELARQFVDGYEEARYSGAAISEARFKELMRIFTFLLRSIQSPTAKYT